MGFFDDVNKALNVGPFGKSSNAATQSGFNKRELQGFMQDAGSLSSAQSRVDTTATGFGPQFKSQVVNKDSLRKANLLNESRDTAFASRQFNVGSNALTEEFTQDQVRGFVKAFSKRQDEVFGRRAQPGISQTRLV